VKLCEPRVKFVGHLAYESWLRGREVGCFAWVAGHVEEQRLARLGDLADDVG
jgi:hypothetical protein